MVVYGKPKSWKSMLLMDMSFRLAQGLPWYGIDTNRASVLLFQLEIPKALFHARVIKYIRGNNSPTNLPISLMNHYTLKLDRDHGLSAMDSILARVKPQVLIIDPLYKVVSGHTSDSQDVGKLIDNIDLLISRHNVAVVIAAHTRKSIITDAGDVVDMGADELLGSIYWSAWPDSLVGIGRRGDIITLKFDTVRHTVRELPHIILKVDRDTLQFKRVGQIAPAIDDWEA